jgi:ATP-dependent Lhr-like helicase
MWLRPDLRATTWPSMVRGLSDRLVLPSVDEKALQGLKFSDALPRHLAEATLATRLADLPNAATVLREPVRFER